MTLREQQVLFARLLPKLIEQAFAMGYEVTMGECYRTPEQAEWNAQHGSGIKNSLHTLRLAVDLLLFKDGFWLQQSVDYQPLGEWWESQSLMVYQCAWGGRFSKPDGGHFSVSWQGIR